jgi:hypothetical protein
MNRLVTSEWGQSENKHFGVSGRKRKRRLFNLFEFFGHSVLQKRTDKEFIIMN